MRVPFPHSLSNTCYYLSCWWQPFSGVRWNLFHCGFDIHFLIVSEADHVCWPFVHLLGRSVCSRPLPIFLTGLKPNLFRKEFFFSAPNLVFLLRIALRLLMATKSTISQTRNIKLSYFTSNIRAISLRNFKSNLSLHPWRMGLLQPITRCLSSKGTYAIRPGPTLPYLVSFLSHFCVPSFHRRTESRIWWLILPRPLRYLFSYPEEHPFT